MAIVLLGLLGLPAPLPPPAKAEPPRQEPTVPGEILERRTETSLTVRNDDGTLTASLFAEPVHFKDEDGLWQPIDTTLSEAPGGGWSSGDNDFTVRFPPRLDGSAVEWEADGQPFSMTLEGAASARGVVDGSSVTYQQAFPGVAVRYDVAASQIKETLTLLHAGTPTRYRFRMDAPAGARADKQEDGSWAFWLPPRADPVFVLPPAYAAEAGQQFDPSEPHASLNVTADGDGFVVDVDVDQGWLKAPGRAFPVQIDPAPSFSAAKSASYGYRLARGGCSGYCYTNDDRLRVGTTNYNAWRSALRFDTSSLPTNADIHSATVGVYYDTTCLNPVATPEFIGNCGVEQHAIDMHRATNDWGYAQDPQYYAFASYSSVLPAPTLSEPVVPAQWMTFNALGLVKGWHAGTNPNYGVVLKRSDEAAGKSGPAFVGPSHATVSRRPYLRVTFDETVQLLTPTVVHSDGAELSWTRYEAASGVPFKSYDVYRSGKLIGSVKDRDTTTFQDTTAAAKKGFDYSIKVNGVGESNRVSVIMPADGYARLDVQPDADAGRAAQIRAYTGVGGSCANYGSGETISIGAGADFQARGVVGFDLSAVPAGATVSVATVSLYHDAIPAGGAVANVGAHALSADWTEGTADGTCAADGVTWENRDAAMPWQSPGGDHDAAAAATVASPAGQSAGWDTFDIKNLAGEWAAGVRGRHGVLLKAADDGALVNYYADDAADAAKRPKLSVTFTDGRSAVKPVVKLTSPTDGAVLTNPSLELTADASDDGGPVSVIFWANGIRVRTVSAPPYKSPWNPVNGPYRLTAQAFDDAGNSHVSAPVDVVVDRSAVPSVSLVTPVFNAALGATPIANPQRVTAEASDDVGVRRVEFLVDGERFRTLVKAPYTFDWNTLDPARVVTDGEHVLTARAYDAQNQVGTSQEVLVKVDNNAATMYRASFASPDLPATFTADTTTTTTTSTTADGGSASGPETSGATITVTNNSTQTWPKSRVKFAYRWLPRDRDPQVTPTNGHVNLPTDVAPGASVSVGVDIVPPALPVGVDRALYTLRLDMFDAADNVYFGDKGSKTKDSPAVVVDHELAKKLGLERYYHYLTTDVGAGMQSLVNVANGNSMLRWTPFVAPGRGLSTVVDLTYNSRERHSRSPAGNAFNLSVSGLLPLGERLKIHQPGKAGHYVEFNDADGTTHRFEAVTADGDPGTVLYYKRPAGVHLYLRAVARDAKRVTRWALTRPDRVTFFFDGDGYPTSVEDGNTNAAGTAANPNRITFGYETVDPKDDPGGADKRITTITDSGGTPITAGASRSFKVDYFKKSDDVQSRVRGRMRRLSDHTGSALDFEYYDDGNLRKLIQRGSTSDNVATSDRAFVFTYTTPDLGGAAITDTWDRQEPSPQTANQSSVLFSVADPENRKETTFTYLDEGNDKGKVASRTDRGGAKTTFAYDIVSRVTTVVEPLTATSSRTSTYAYDTAGRVTRIVNPKQEATSVVWSDDNHVEKVSKEATGNFAGASTSYTYDTNGYITSSTDELGNTTELGYTYESVDANDTPATNGGRQPHISVLATKTSPEGVATPESEKPNDYQWDFSHTGSHLTKVVEPADAKGVRHETRYAYFDNGDLNTVTDANNHVTEFQTYDANGLPTRVSDPLGNVTTMRFDDDGLLNSVKDAEHQRFPANDETTRTEFVYDAFHRLRRQSTPKSTRLNLGLLWTGTDYDLNDNVVAQAQPHAGTRYGPAPGDITTMSYDDLDRLTEVAGPDTTPGPDGQPQAERTRMAYDLAGRTTRVTEPLGVLTDDIPNDYQTQYRYDDLDRVIRELRGQDLGADDRKVTNYCYDVAGDLVRVTAPEAGLATVDCAGARPTHTTVFTYDLAHRRTSSDDPESARTAERYGYDGNGNLTQTRFTQDKADADLGVVADVETRVYDQRDRLVRVDEPFDRPSGADTVTTQAVYDGVGNVIEVVSPRGWDASSDKVTFTDYVTRYVYDAADQLTTVKLPTDGDTKAAYVHHAYDANGRLDWTTLPTTVGRQDLQLDPETGWPTNIDASLRTHVEYYDTGWVRTTDDGPNPPVRFDYTPEGWQSSRVPLTGGDKPLAGAEVSDEKIRWTYEDDGQLREQHVSKRGMDGTVLYEYDANNRLTRATDTVGATVATQRPVVAETAYDTLNRVEKVRHRKQASGAPENPWRYTRFEYDRNDNPVWRYDNGEEGAATTAPKAHELLYDEANWLVSTFERGTDVADVTDDRRIVTEFHPRGWERQRQISRYDASAAADSWRAVQTTRWARHANGELRELVTRSGGDDGTVKERHDVDYLDGAGRYVNGNRTRDTFTMANKTSDSGEAPPCQTGSCVLEYAYDARDRLVRERRSGSDAYKGRTEYDLTVTGGIKTETTYNSLDVPSKTRTWDYAGDRMTKLTDDGVASRYLYDVDGNVDCVIADTDPGQTGCGANLVADYGYDKLNRMETFKGWDTVGGDPSDESTYEYDALDRVFTQSERHDSTSRTTTFSYIGLTNTVSGEDHYSGAAATGTPTTSKSYSFDAFGNRVTMTNKQAGQALETFTYGYDVHGSVSLLLAEGGGVKAAYGYGPYGEADEALTNGDDDEDEPFNPYRYTGKRYDSGSKTLDMGARRFGPDTTKFLQQDQYLGALTDLGLSTDPLTQNRYSLAGGNPVSFIEVDGHRVLEYTDGSSSYTPQPTKGSGADWRQAETQTWTSSTGTSGSTAGGSSGAGAPVERPSGESPPRGYGPAPGDKVDDEILGDFFVELFGVNDANKAFFGRSKTEDHQPVGPGGRGLGLIGISPIGRIATLLKGLRFADEVGDAAGLGAKAKKGDPQSGADDLAGAACSFSASTTVLMADGTRKAISDIEVGDYVVAEDPETGERGARQVTHVWVHDDTVVDLEIDGDVVTTTEDHPFWNATHREWQQAQELDVGDLVRTADGDLVEVGGLRLRTARTTTAFNLTVDEIHTYFVGAGENEVLVHNDNTCGPLSPNQMNQAIRRSQAPRGITRIDTPKVTGEQFHATFEGGAALNIDGTWKHGYVELTRAQRDWLRANGWDL